MEVLVSIIFQKMNNKGMKRGKLAVEAKGDLIILYLTIKTFCCTNCLN